MSVSRLPRALALAVCMLPGTALALAVCMLPDPASAQAAASAQSSGDALIFVGTYGRAIYVIDEATETVAERIPLRTGIPVTLVPNEAKTRFYVRDASFENIEVVDIAERRTLYTFSLSKAGEQVRIWSFNIDPAERFAILLAKSYRKRADRYEVSGPMLLRYDLREHAVTDTIKWPEGREQEFARLLFSPDGAHLYFFGDSSTIVLETERFTEVDRWQYAESLDQGMGRFEFGFPAQTYEEPGFFTGLFRYADPVQNRRMMGVARVNLAERQVDFFPLGPSENVSFSLAPGRQRAYGLRQEVGNWELYTFDLVGRRISARTRFAGRPRMALMPSSNGSNIYIYLAGNTIDVYDAATFAYLRTIELDADTTTGLVVLPRSVGARRVD